VHNTSNPPDLRIKVAKKEQQKITERTGESQTQVAADYKITQPSVSQSAKKKRWPGEVGEPGEARDNSPHPPGPLSERLSY